MEYKVKFKLERVYNPEAHAMQVVIHRDGMSPQHLPLAKKDIALVTIVANSLASVLDYTNVWEDSAVEYELTAKVLRP